MNKQSIGKLSLFIMGLVQRLGDNIEYFKKMTVEFKSGTKIYTAHISLFDENNLKINFNGSTENIPFAEIGNKISKYAESYEYLQLTYEERGTTILIEADNKNVKMKTKDTNPEELVKAHNEISQISNRDYLIKVGQADKLLEEIGILGTNGKVKNDMIRKYNQIDHFVELISDLLKDLADKYESINVLDCGCGKSYLTFVLNYYIKEVLKKPCYFIGLDYSNTVIEASRNMAKNLGYSNMEFNVTDIKSYTANRDIQLVISLHACDTATDEAIALTVRNNVKSMVMVPCCHREILKQYSFEAFSPILKHGILKARMADVLTDGMRALYLEALGYKVSIVEYISPLETPKNLMLRAEKTGAASKKAMDEYNQLKKLLNIQPTLERILYSEN